MKEEIVTHFESSTHSKDISSVTLLHLEIYVHDDVS